MKKIIDRVNAMMDRSVMGFPPETLFEDGLRLAGIFASGIGACFLCTIIFIFGVVLSPFMLLAAVNRIVRKAVRK